VAIAQFLLRRLGLAIITLFLLSVIIFVAAQLLPGDVGRAILGPFADQRAVDQLNEELGTDRSIFVQYGDWIGGVVTGDLGESYAFRRPVEELLWPALRASAKLALLAFVWSQRRQERDTRPPLPPPSPPEGPTMAVPKGRVR